MPGVANTSSGLAIHALGSFSSPGNSNVPDETVGRYENIEITGSGGGSGTFTVTFSTPTGDYHSARKCIINSSNLLLRLTLASGAFVDISAGAKIDVLIRPGGVYQIS